METVNVNRNLSRFLILFFLSLVFTGTYAQQANKDFQPYSGQAGKDVVWVPTSQALVEKMLDIAKVTPNDFVIDLGSGDGRTVITAAKRGARARGVEYDPNMIELSKKNAAKEGVTGKVEFLQGDLFKADLSQATVITLFLLPSINLRLRPSLLELRPGTRIVSNTFTMGEWTPDQRAKATEDCNNWCDALLWIVPAKVNGLWKLNQGQLELNQEFQMISGTLKTGKKKIKITDGKMNGNQITFTVDKDKYAGVVNGSSMNGTILSSRNNSKWNALRTRN
jgi:precorrin-6B methylase 2